MVITFALLTCLQTNAVGVGWINVKESYNAIGDGVSDDTVPISGAIASLPPDGGTLYFPRGIYLVSAQLVVRDRRVAFVGDGPGLSQVVWNSANGGLLYIADSSQSPTAVTNREFSVEGLSLKTSRTRTDAGTAIVAIWPGNNADGNPCGRGTVAPTARIRNVHIRGAGWGNNWSGGILLTEARNSTLQDLEIYGSPTDSYGMGYGIKVFSDYNSTDYSLKNIRVYFANLGLWVTGGIGTCGGEGGNGPEGVLVDQSAFIGVYQGILFNPTASEPLLIVRGSHFNTGNVGVYTKAQQSIIESNHFYVRGYGVYVFGGSVTRDVAVRNNVFYGASGSNDIVINAWNSSVTGNQLGPLDGATSADTGIWLVSGSQNNFVAQNVFSGTFRATRVYDQGAGNTVFGWGASPP